jgi:hypothetical protein
MNTPKSYKPYHGCFGRFQGRLDRSASFNSGEWVEVVGKKEKKKRSKRFARFWSGCKKDSSHQKWWKKSPKEKLCETWQQEAAG